jgi:hypothetical protein
LVELLVVMGVVCTLIALAIPAIGGARKTSFEPGCLANLRQLHSLVSLYAESNRQAWPFPLLKDRGQSLTVRLPDDKDFELEKEYDGYPGYLWTSAVWYTPLLGDHDAKVIRRTLVCPGEGARQSNLRAGVGAGTTYNATHGLAIQPRAFVAPGREILKPENWIGTRTTDVLFPSSKGLLIEAIAVHENWFRDATHVARPGHWRHMVLACDGSAALRAKNSWIDGIVPKVPFSHQSTDPKDWSIFATPDGIRGHDW